MTVVTNTTIVSNFAAVSRLSLLNQLWKQVYLPEQVFAEVQSGLNSGYAFYEGIEAYIHPWTEGGWLHLTGLQTSEELELFGRLLGRLHTGEAASITLAYHRGWTFLSDDKAARQAARLLEIPVAGTIGILIALVRRQHLTLEAADGLLTHMRTHGYFSPVETLRDLST